MCEFSVGDDVVCVSDDWFNEWGVKTSEGPKAGDVLPVAKINLDPLWGPYIEFAAFDGQDFAPENFRKVERKSDSLSIETFLTIKPNQFEGPKRTNQPAKRKEQA